MIKRIVLFFLLTLTALHAKVSPQDEIKKAEKILPHQCIFYFKMYLNAESPKAFAYAMDANDKVTCRFSATASTQQKADKLALLSCQTSSLEKEIISECKLYKSDSNVTKSQKKLTFQEKYLLNLSKIQEAKKTDLKKPKKKTKKQKIPKKVTEKKSKLTKTDIEDDLSKLPKKCKMFYRLYQKASQHKAFAIAVDSEKKYVCKYSAKSTSKKRAQEVALNSCQKTKTKRNIKNPCKLLMPKKEEKKESPSTLHIKKEPTKKVKPKIVPKNNTAKKRPNTQGSPALQKAILNADLKKIKQLIKKGANVNTESSDKSRALFVAVAKGDITFTKKLLAMGAYPYVKKKDGNNLLVAAIMSGSNKMLKLMLEQGIDPNIRCEEGNTPLHFALMMFDDAMMKTLYTYGAQDDIKNKKGKSVQDLAKELRLNLKRIRR